MRRTFARLHALLRCFYPDRTLIYRLTLNSVIPAHRFMKYADVETIFFQFLAGY
jgi:hypothetical protein